MNKHNFNNKIMNKEVINKNKNFLKKVKTKKLYTLNKIEDIENNIKTLNNQLEDNKELLCALLEYDKTLDNYMEYINNSIENINNI